MRTRDAVALDPIDEFINARLATHGLIPVKEASRTTVMRRLYFDLIGLPPTLPEQREFLSDTSLDAYERLVDRLLGSNHFGERWGRHWLDLARFSETNGSDRNVIFPHAWRYRHYVIDAFNADRPYNQFIREQVAGDLLPWTSCAQRDRQLVGTGFLTFGAKTLMDDKPERFRMDRVDDQIDVVSRAVLGLTISCARCHDHKFDPITTADYYALAGIFRSTFLAYGPAAPAGNQYGHDRPLEPIGVDGEKLHGPAREWQLAVAEQIKVRNKARSDRYRDVRGRSGKQNELKKVTAELAAAKGDTEAADFANHSARAETLQQEIESLDATIARWDEKIKALDLQLKQIEDNPPPFPDYAMAAREDETIEDCRIRIAGEYNTLGDPVARGMPAALSRGDASIPDGQSGRRQLARWLTNDQNPLTARVAVNRIWQHLFGEGLVRSVDNFGHLGERPSHPELLDWLAVQFMREGWSTKRLIRRIVLSCAYRRGSSSRAHAAISIDPDNRLLWRQNQRRLEAEPLRDAMLAVSGQLLRQRPSASPIAAMKDRELNATVRLTSEQLNQRVRTVYLPVARQSLPEWLEVFDFADPSLVVGKRAATATSAQQLFLLNNPFVQELAGGAAQKLLAARGLVAEAEHAARDDATRIDRLYQEFFARAPSGAERERGLRFLADWRSPPPRPDNTETPAKPATSDAELVDRADATRLGAWTDFCHALLASGEFQYIE
jgi:hypothetical protein